MRRASWVLLRSFLTSAGIAVAAISCSGTATTRGSSAQGSNATHEAKPDKYADVIAAPLPIAQEVTPPLPPAPPATAVLLPPPPLRKQGDLTVSSPPLKLGPYHEGRLRSNVQGSLSKGSPRSWIGIEVPSFVQLMVAEAELFLLDDVGADGFLAFYREPYGASGCQLVNNAQNCTFGAVLYDKQGGVTWKVALSKLLSRPDHLEIQDIRYANGVLYFNEACQSYAREAAGHCSSLVAYDPKEKRVLWRTPPLTSNNVFAVLSSYVIAGYGFTGEPDAISIVSRTDGKIVARIPLPAAHQYFEVRADGTLLVEHYYEKQILFRMSGFDGDQPKLVPIKRSDKRDL